MRAGIAKLVAPIASLAAQRRYLIHGTPEAYLVPTDLLEDTAEVVGLVRADAGARDALPVDAVRAILDLEEPLDAAGRSVASGASNADLVKRDEAWTALRDRAIQCLGVLGFDLQEWERSQGLR